MSKNFNVLAQLEVIKIWVEFRIRYKKSPRMIWPKIKKCPTPTILLVDDSVEQACDDCKDKQGFCKDCPFFDQFFGGWKSERGLYQRSTLYCTKPNKGSTLVLYLCLYGVGENSHLCTFVKNQYKACLKTCTNTCVQF